MKKVVLRMLAILALISSLVVFTACDEDIDDDSDFDKDDVSIKDLKDEDKKLLSEKEAKNLLEEYYDIAESMYFLDFDELDIGDEAIDYSKYELFNYEEILNKYFSKDFADEFYPALLLKENGKYYIGFGGFAEYIDDLRFEDIEIEEDEISCIVSCDVWVEEKIEDDKKREFSIVKEDGTWKIDEYTAY